MLPNVGKPRDGMERRKSRRGTVVDPIVSQKVFTKRGMGKNLPRMPTR